MPRVKVGSKSGLGPGEILEAEVNGRPFAVCNVDGELHAVDGQCPHRGGPLAHGALHDETLVCPWHAWEFDCTTGANLGGGQGIAKVVVAVEGDDILLDLP